MKKILVLAAAAMLFAVPAFSGIKDTAHDLSSGNANGAGSDTTEICVFCHTPHGAGAAGFAPLWNRTTISATDVYGNPAGTMNAVPTIGAVNASDAVLCLSCHDGNSIATGLNNPPNSLAGADPTVTAGLLGADANLGTAMSNDHPVGFAFNAALVGLDDELTLANSPQLFGTGNDMMWCSSCHDVHDNTNSPFLLSTNVGSALCLTCHVK